MPSFHARAWSKTKLAASLIDCSVGSFGKSVSSKPIPKNSSTSFLLFFMVTKGDPAISVWSTTSSFSVCFFTMISFVVASRPPIIRNPSLEIIQRNFSNQNFCLSSTCFIAETNSVPAKFSSTSSFFSLNSVIVFFTPTSFFRAFFASSKYFAAFSSTDLVIESAIFIRIS